MAGDKQKNRSETKSDLEEKVLYINRCAKTVKGGKKFSFSALILVGNGSGEIGIGFAKANEVADAIRKASESAKKNMVGFETKGTTIPHAVEGKWDGAHVFLKPASEGAGVIAGSKVRAVLELGGVKDVVAKSLGCSNPINIVRATVCALQDLKNRNEILQLRGL